MSGFDEVMEGSVEPTLCKDTTAETAPPKETEGVNWSEVEATESIDEGAKSEPDDDIGWQAPIEDSEHTPATTPPPEMTAPPVQMEPAWSTDEGEAETTLPKETETVKATESSKQEEETKPEETTGKDTGSNAPDWRVTPDEAHAMPVPDPQETDSSASPADVFTAPTGETIATTETQISEVQERAESYLNGSGLLFAALALLLALIVSVFIITVRRNGAKKGNLSNEKTL